MNTSDSTKSPCIGVCKLNEHLICYGCGRTVEEIRKAGEKRSLPIVIQCDMITTDTNKIHQSLK